jgi:hypothetical protein
MLDTCQFRADVSPSTGLRFHAVPNRSVATGGVGIFHAQVMTRMNVHTGGGFCLGNENAGFSGHISGFSEVGEEKYAFDAVS